ncbi:hypothetical protein CsSME_00014381 [Camellia sinensis var. sinensis]
MSDASARKAEAERKRAEDIAAGVVQMNGRELFAHEPWFAVNLKESELLWHQRTNLLMQIDISFCILYALLHKDTS